MHRLTFMSESYTLPPISGYFARFDRWRVRKMIRNAPPISHLSLGQWLVNSGRFVLARQLDPRTGENK